MLGRGRVPYLHGGHVLKNILEVLFAGESGEFAGNHILPLASNHLGGVAGIHSLKAGLVRLDEEGVIVVVVGHDCELRMSSFPWYRKDGKARWEIEKYKRWRVGYVSVVDAS